LLRFSNQDRFAAAEISRASSVRVTERHYNPWVRSRQEQLEADVPRARKLDPVLKTKNFAKSYDFSLRERQITKHQKIALT
jgi:hypothetical protein